MAFGTAPRLIGLVLLSQALLGGGALAGGVSIFVSSTRDKTCLPPLGVEEVQYLLTPSETRRALRRYFRSESNPELYDAAIVNAGLKFCGAAERSEVFRDLVAELEAAKPDRRVFEVIRNYSRSETLLREIRSRLSQKDLTPELHRNLTKAESLVLETRSR